MNNFFDPDVRVADLLDLSHPAAEIFHTWKLDCPGCTLDVFCTLADVMREYHLDEFQFLRSLSAAVDPS